MLRQEAWSLHADEAGQNIFQTFRQRGARQSFTQNDCPLGVHGADMKGVFPDIDADVRDDDIRIDGDHDGVLQMPEWLARRYIRWHSQHEEPTARQPRAVKPIAAQR